MADPNYGKMTSMHFYGWKQGLKTGQYYLRSRPARDAIKFTVNMEALLKASDQGNSEALLSCLSGAIEGGDSLKKSKVVSEDDQSTELSSTSIIERGSPD
jgi:hypothetical protein